MVIYNSIIGENKQDKKEYKKKSMKLMASLFKMCVFK